MCRIAFALAAAVLLSLPAHAITIPERPAWPNFVLDEAGMLNESDELQINVISQELFKEFQTQLYVVTVPSMTAMDAAGMHPDDYAEALFNSWGIGTRQKNDGILLLVSKGDRKARIELGAAWKHNFDEDAQAVMDGMIIPHFKKGQFSRGILEGARGLDQMARGEPIERPSTPGGNWNWLIPAGLLGLIFMGRGRSRYYHHSGWHSTGWGGGGGGFGGGGSSGGGGASGSW